MFARPNFVHHCQTLRSHPNGRFCELRLLGGDYPVADLTDQVEKIFALFTGFDTDPLLLRQPKVCSCEYMPAVLVPEDSAVVFAGVKV
tara:strand:+ start:58226 stop:58489 length:264 start_codon:yes stop_codon:yes gene_type:complete